MIAAGDTAPDFELLDQDGNQVKLSDHRGRHVVVYFYPKADTPGCTTQACGIRDRTADYEAANALVLGISPDKPDALRKFADKYGLPFTLRAVLRDAGPGLVREHWPGPPESLEAMLRLAGAGRA